MTLSLEKGSVLTSAIRSLTVAAILFGVLGSQGAIARPIKKQSTNNDLFDEDLSFFNRGNPKVKEVALSIDDGPHILYAPKILEILRQNHAHATFFVVGKKVLEHPELAREMVADGNEIGNHSMTHPRLNTLPLDEVRDEITQCEAAVLKATGVTTRLLRPPGERYNDNDLLVAKKLHYITVAANIGANDYILPGDRSWYRGNPGYQEHLDSISKSVFKQLKNGGIIDIHDMPTTADALEIVIKGIRSRGYKIVTVSELLEHLPGRRG
jgi:peptidoglycan/xylan/chitin deacetylase (PgdA/CDA1 family)